MQKIPPMKIERKNLKFNRLVELDNIIDDSCLFYMEQADIDSDEIIHNEILHENETIYVFQNNKEPHRGERYCYVITETIIGGDGKTKMIIVKKIITDTQFISESFFTRIFTILLQQENIPSSNRIAVGEKINKRFCGAIDTTSVKISQYICDLFNDFTGDNCSIYEIKDSI